MLTVSSCQCEDAVRQMISNPGNRKAKVEQAEQRRQKSESSAPHEQEPNNFPKQATLVELGGDLRPVEAAIADAKDHDWFALKSRDGEAWQVQATVTPTSKTLDPIIRVAVAGSEDAPTEYDVAGPGEAETIPILGVSGDPQRIMVVGKNGTAGGYKLSFEKRLSGGAIEAEPNDDINAATRFEAPGEIEGFYDRPNDRDVYFVPRKKLVGDVFNLEVSPVDGVMQQVNVYTHRSLQTPYAAFQVPPTQAAGLPNLLLPKDALGVWVVMTAGKSYSRKHSYRLKLLAHPPSEHDLEAEPNDSVDTAQKIALGANLVGFFHTPADVDYFRLYVDGVPEQGQGAAQADAGTPAEAKDAGVQLNAASADAGTADVGGADAAMPQTPPNPLAAVADKTPPRHVVQVTVTPKRQKGRVVLQSLDAAGNATQTLESQEPGAAVILCNRPVDHGYLDLQVHPVQGTEAGLKSGVDYALTTKDVRDEPGLEVEPNDGRNTADKLTPQHKRVGFINHAGDQDVYAFAVPYPTPPPHEVGTAKAGLPNAGVPAAPAAPTPPKARKVRVILGANPLNLGFKLLDDEGGLVAQVNRAGAGGEERLQVDLPPGLYFVHVAAKRGFACKPYTLSVSVAPPAP